MEPGKLQCFTCTSRATLLWVSHWIFTSQNRTFNAVAFHMTRLYVHPHKSRQKHWHIMHSMRIWHVHAPTCLHRKTATLKLGNSWIINCILYAKLDTYFCASTAHAEHESERLQIGMPAISWPVRLLFKCAENTWHCMQHKHTFIWFLKISSIINVKCSRYKTRFTVYLDISQGHDTKMLFTTKKRVSYW